jgi:hypothetical protein
MTCVLLSGADGHGCSQVTSQCALPSLQCRTSTIRLRAALSVCCLLRVLPRVVSQDFEGGHIKVRCVPL